MMLKVYITWALLLGIVVYEIHTSFARYFTDKNKWKLGFHTVLLFIFSILCLQMGFFALEMQYDVPQLPNATFTPVPVKRTAAQSQKLKLQKKALKPALPGTTGKP